jgi:uncharacterized repeat protein (TIGR03803 family)
MKARKSRFTLDLALACAAITFSLAVCAQAQTLTYFSYFDGTNGEGPVGPLVQATDGNFYGVAGLPTGGEVYRVTPGGEINTVYSFCSQPNCADGETPISPILGSDGNLYGTTYLGGSTNSGTIYKLTLDGKLTTLYTFNCPGAFCRDGANPTGIIQASDGNFYGTTAAGGDVTLPSGVLFGVTPAGDFKLLYTFCSLTDCTDGGFPFAPPTQGSDGNFYGTAGSGGTQEGGVLYKLTSAGVYSVLHSFCYGGSDCFNNAGPTKLVQDSEGNFFGTTSWAGGYNSGSVFEFTAKNKLTLLHMFTYSGQEDPGIALTLANDGNLYGVAEDNDYDDSNGSGLIYEATPGGVFTPFFTLYNLNGADSAFWNGPLLQATDGNFYGTTVFGTNSHSGSGYGTVYRFSNGLDPLVETVPVAGKVGTHVIILGNGLRGSTSVTFNGKEADFTVVSDTEITATVPHGATTGTVSVVTPSGTLNSNPQFVVTK